MAVELLQDAPRELVALKAQQDSLLLKHFTADDAFILGTYLRTRLRFLTPTAAVINITLTNSDNVLFHAWSRPGAMPDNDVWIARKRTTVKRFGVSSWYMAVKYQGDELAFRNKFGLGEKAGEYAIHGGGVPVFVEGVEGVVAVVVVSGLKQDQDHMVVIEGLQKLKAEVLVAGS